MKNDNYLEKLKDDFIATYATSFHELIDKISAIEDKSDMLCAVTMMTKGKIRKCYNNIDKAIEILEKDFDKLLLKSILYRFITFKREATLAEIEEYLGKIGYAVEKKEMKKLLKEMEEQDDGKIMNIKLNQLLQS